MDKGKYIKCRQYLELADKWVDIFTASTRSEAKRLKKSLDLEGRDDIAYVLIEEKEIQI